MKKLYWIIGACVAVLILFIVWKAVQGTAPTEVATDKAALRTITENVSANGKIQPEAELKITSDVSGEVVEMMVKEGDQVKKGQLLCRIKPDIYESAFERANATVNSSKASLKTSQAQVLQAKANLVQAEATYNRNKKLFEQNVISQQEMDAARATFEAAKANVTGLEASISAADFNVKSVEASLREANSNLDKTFIYAPVDGTVSKLNVEKGERVQGVQGIQGTEILRLANLNEMETSVEVNENDIIRIHKNDTALIDVDAYLGRKFKGIVTEIANSANTVGTSVDQVTNFVVKVRLLRESYVTLITPENPAPFRPGMSASVEIQTKRVQNVISVPVQAVTTRNADTTKANRPNPNEEPETVVKNLDEEKQNAKARKEELKECVFVVEQGKAKMVYVKTGIQDNDYIEVTQGLKPGAEVIIAPYNAVSKLLRKDMKVKVVPADKLFTEKK